MREELDTQTLPTQMEFGSGDDQITFAGNQTGAFLLTDAAGGFDTLEFSGSIDPTFTIAAGRAVNFGLDVTYSGFDQFNLLDPTVDLTLEAAPRRARRLILVPSAWACWPSASICRWT